MYGKEVLGVQGEGRRTEDLSGGGVKEIEVESCRIVVPRVQNGSSTGLTVGVPPSTSPEFLEE